MKRSVPRVFQVALLALLLVGCGDRQSKKLVDRWTGTDYRGQTVSMAFAPAARTRVQRFLFPLPQEHSFAAQVFSFPATECVLVAGSELGDREHQFIADFNARWEKRAGAALKPKRGKNLQLIIIVGRNGANRDLARAAETQLLDLDRLAACPNSDQAYALTCAKTDTGATVYLAANAAPGLYYALGTLEQIVTALGRPGTVTVPEIRILDWPDIPMRGIWGGTRGARP